MSNLDHRRQNEGDDEYIRRCFSDWIAGDRYHDGEWRGREYPLPPMTLLTCEPCDGYGGCEADDGCEVECEYCHGLGAIVFEGETDTEQGEAL